MANWQPPIVPLIFCGRRFSISEVGVIREVAVRCGEIIRRGEMMMHVDAKRRRVGRHRRVRPRTWRARGGAGGETGRRCKQPAAAEAAAAGAREVWCPGVGCGGHA